MAATAKTMTQICESLNKANYLLLEVLSNLQESFGNKYDTELFSVSDFDSICKITLWKLRDVNTKHEFTELVEQAEEKIQSILNYTYRTGFEEELSIRYDSLNELNDSIFQNIMDLGDQLFRMPEKLAKENIERYLAKSENDLFDLQIVIEGVDE
jgi:hypothetical protein